jgi:hypothetical protein
VRALTVTGCRHQVETQPTLHGIVVGSLLTKECEAGTVEFMGLSTQPDGQTRQNILLGAALKVITWDARVLCCYHRQSMQTSDTINKQVRSLYTPLRCSSMSWLSIAIVSWQIQSNRTSLDSTHSLCPNEVHPRCFVSIRYHARALYPTRASVPCS